MAESNGVELITINGNLFPAFEGQALSWSFDDCWDQATKGYPKMRTVIRAMIVYRPEQLERERFEFLKASFNNVFGQNAKRVLNVIEEEIAAAKTAVQS